ncbi:MAG TPA: hypothetical protein G4O02_06705 [Caldilineae bacterium]|jgi:hypothetical protein|nr:hypothetical protein [Caldilineae bacterium]
MRRLGFARVVEALPGLTDGELQAVIGRATELLEERAQVQEQGASDERPEMRKLEGGGPGGHGGRGWWLEVRMINGCGPYVYKRWREGKRKRSEYLGKAKMAATA